MTYAVNAVGAIGTLVAMLVVAGGDVGAGVVPFAVWALLPYGVLAAAGYSLRSTFLRRAVAATSGLVVGLALAFYAPAFFESDAQGALVFVIAPVLQLAISGAAGAVAGVVRLARR